VAHFWHFTLHLTVTLCVSSLTSLSCHTAAAIDLLPKSRIKMMCEVVAVFLDSRLAALQGCCAGCATGGSCLLGVDREYSQFRGGLGVGFGAWRLWRLAVGMGDSTCMHRGMQKTKLNPSRFDKQQAARQASWLKHGCCLLHWSWCKTSPILSSSWTLNAAQMLQSEVCGSNVERDPERGHYLHCRSLDSCSRPTSCLRRRR